MVEVEGTSVSNSSPSVPLPTASAPTETADPSSTSQHPSEHILVTSRDFLVVMDAVHTFTATSASFAASHTGLAERMARAEVTLAHNQAILLQIQSHVCIPPITVTAPIPPTTHRQSAVSALSASLDVLADAVVAFDPPTSTPPAQ